MDLVVNRLSEIEAAAVRIMEDAAAQKKELERLAQQRVDEYSAKVDQTTADALAHLQETLEADMKRQLSQLDAEAADTIRGMEADYEANHEAMANQLLKEMIGE